MKKYIFIYIQQKSSLVIHKLQVVYLNSMMHYLQNIVNISEVVQYVHAMNNFSHFIEQPNLYILQLKNKTKTQFAVKRREKKRFPYN